MIAWDSYIMQKYGKSVWKLIAESQLPALKWIMTFRAVESKKLAELEEDAKRYPVFVE